MPIERLGTSVYDRTIVDIMSADASTNGRRLADFRPGHSGKPTPNPAFERTRRFAASSSKQRWRRAAQLVVRPLREEECRQRNP